MAGNTVQVNSSGALRVKSNGIVVGGASDACCCTPTCVVTSYLCGATLAQSPATVTVVISGTAGCSCKGGGPSLRMTGNADGTYVCTETSPGSNRWTYTTTSGPTFEWFQSTSNCTGSPCIFTRFTVTVVYSPGLLTISATIQNVTSGGLCPPTTNTDSVFDGIEFFCVSNGGSLSNNNDCADLNPIASGGTATISWTC